MALVQHLQYKSVKCIFHHSNRYCTKFHKFETIVRERSISSIPANDPVIGIVHEMKQFVHEFNNHENMEDFWTRKSTQNVLSIVQCLFEDEYQYFRGRNIEVSLPSGSICAERSAIANATSNNLLLYRHNFKRIAVIDPYSNIIGLEPCGVCKEYLRKFQEASPEFCLITFPDDEFQSIYEHFPANYPVQNVDAEQTQKALDEIWKCSACNTNNSGYSTSCCLCGHNKNQTTARNYKIFENPELILKVINVIDEHFRDKTFTYHSLQSQLNAFHPKQSQIVNSVLFHLASSRREILSRKGSNGFRIKHQQFDQYKVTLTKHIECV